MSTGDENPEDVSLRYWKAVISSLPPEKRDAAWEFYLNKFGTDRAGDTLSGLILLLEAHGVYMQNLPLAYEAEVIKPLEQIFASMRKEFAVHSKHQSDTRESNATALNQLSEATSTIHQAAEEVGSKIQASLLHIDSERIAERICHSINTYTLNRLWLALDRLGSAATTMDKVSEKAAQSVELWRKLHIGGVFTWASATAFVCSVIICWFAHQKMRTHYEKQFQQKIAHLQKAHP